MKPKRLPNGFGSISKLSGNRSRPFMVRSTNREIIGYAETYEDAYLLLCEYNKSPWDVKLKNATVEDIWEIFCETEMDRYSKSRQNAFHSHYNKYLSKMKDKQYASLKTYHYIRFLKAQDCSDNTRNQIIALLKHLDDVAYQLDIIDKKYAYELKGKSFERKGKRQPFTEEEIETLWEHVNEDFVDYILIMIYTGFRLNELVGMPIENIDTEHWTMTGGSKTKAGKNRVVPVHPRIRPLVVKIIQDGREKLFEQSENTFHRKFKKVTKKLLGRAFIPHEARHTMRTRLDRAGANKVCTDRILGHKSGDVGEDVYTHKTIEELLEAVELLK